MESNVALRRVVHVVQGPKPDDRGQLMVVAITEGRHVVVLVLPVNWPKGDAASVLGSSIARAVAAVLTLGLR